MAGILDNKERVMDVFITPLGRAQMASGQMIIEYASFTDRQIVYTSGSSGALEDLTDRLYFEAQSTESDTVIYEIDGNGDLSPFNVGVYTVSGDTITYTTSSASGETLAVSGSIDLISAEICEESGKHFKRLGIIGTRDLFREDKGAQFAFSPTTGSFEVRDDYPIDYTVDTTYSTIDDLPCTFADNRLGHLSNFEYLAPQNKPHAGAATGSALASYSRLSTPAVSEWSDLGDWLENYDYELITFDETSSENNLLCQIFEETSSGQQHSQGSGTIEKLAVIDYGTFTVDETTARTAHVFYAGKIFRDSAGCLCFANLFTFVFDDEAE